MRSIPRQPSLVSTLFIRVVLLLTATTAAIGAASYWIAKDRIDGIYDAELIAGANVLRTLVEEELEQQAEEAKEKEKEGQEEATSDAGALLSAEDIASFNTYTQGLRIWRMFRIWRNGKLAIASKSGPAGMRAPSRVGFVDVSDTDRTWRLYTFSDSGSRISITVGEPMSVRQAVVGQFALALIAPLVLLVPVSSALIWLTLLDGLGALRRLGVALHAKSGDNLSPLDGSQWPRDLGGLLTAINGLLRRLDRSFSQTLSFTDHAAHELRTPLAGLKLNVQMLVKEKDPRQQAAILRRLQEGADHSAALVEQLLTLSRLDSGAFQHMSSDLAAVAKSVLEEAAPIASASDVLLALTGEPTIRVQADTLLLKMIVSNLVGNAIKQSPPGREVAIDIAHEVARNGAPAVRLSVTDHGPGIPPNERQRVFERFYRADSSKPGVGLGLSIVAEALALIGGSIELDAPEWGTGLRAVVRLPAP